MLRIIYENHVSSLTITVESVARLAGEVCDRWDNAFREFERREQRLLAQKAVPGRIYDRRWPGAATPTLGQIHFANSVLKRDENGARRGSKEGLGDFHAGGGKIDNILSISFDGLCGRAAALEFDK